MDKITEIEHTGYRGPGTEGRHLPPGKYTVGDKLDFVTHIVPADLAAYLVATGQAVVTLFEPEVKQITVVCDRCGKEVNGMEGAGGTAGFYRVGEGSLWHQYANEGESVLCDACMQSDPRYLADYPPVSSPTPEQGLVSPVDKDEILPSEMVVNLGEGADVPPTEADVAAARIALEAMDMVDLRKMVVESGLKVAKGVTKAELIDQIITHG